MYKIRKYLLTLLLVLFIWFLISFFKMINPVFLPSPGETLSEAISLISSGAIIKDLLYSLSRSLYGVTISLIIGVPTGLILGYYDRIYTYVDCLIDFFRSIPPIIVFPLALLIFGIGDSSRIAVIVFGCTTIVILNSASGVHNSSKLRINVARIYGAKGHQIFFRVILFNALPQIFVGIRVALSMGIIIEIVTEMLVGTKYGLGNRAVYAQTSYNTPELYVTIIFIGLIGFFINKGLIKIEKNIIHWKDAL